MSTPILATKLYISPPRSEIVPRSRLIERLNEGLKGKLTLISAPAGFGKTTLVGAWVADCQRRTAWLSLDKDDSDATRFLTYLIAALQTIEKSIGKGVWSALQSPRPPPPEAILVPLVNDIAAISARIILVLDDYYLVESSAIDQALTFLLEHLPPQLHLVIATRDDPHLPLARFRARGQLTELRAANLRFTTAEAAEFLNQVMGLELSAENIAALEARTEGWIAGLQLAAISMQGHKDITSFIKSFTGSHHFVLDYLLEEVLYQQPESIQTFLLQTAVLNRLTGPLCDALTDQNNGQATLYSLERANLFIIPLDVERRWYRYHHLFADLLRRQMHQVHPAQIPTLYLRASEWHHQNGFTDEAIEYALHAEDFERAMHLIEQVAETVWMDGEHTKLRRWLERLPLKVVCTKPQLCIFHGWYLLADGQLDGADRVLQAAEQALTTGLDGPHNLNKITLQGRVAATRAFSAFYRGDIPEIIQHARQALEYLPAQDSSWRGTAIHVLGDAYDFKGEMANAYHSRLEALEASSVTGNTFLVMIASLKLAIVLRQQGRLQRVCEICEQQMQLANENGMAQTVVVGWLLAIWGEALAEINDLDGGGIHQAKKGVEITERGGDLAMLGWSYLCLIRVLFTWGDLISAEEIVNKIEITARKSFVPPWIMHLKAAWQARIWLAQGKFEAASRWVATRGLDPLTDDLTYLHEMEYIVLARILIAQGRLDETTGLLRRLLESAEAGGRTTRVIEILLLQAMSFQAGGDTAQATTTLEHALSLAEPGGYIRIFVDEGLPLARLLYEVVDRGIAPDYVGKLLTAFPDFETTSTTPSEISPKRPESRIVEPLSERELEVLQIIAAGLTNQEVAARLFLTLNTVKAHTRNIYGKLDVHNRTQAVGKAKALGILPSD